MNIKRRVLITLASILASLKSLSGSTPSNLTTPKFKWRRLLDTEIVFGDDIYANFDPNQLHSSVSNLFGPDATLVLNGTFILFKIEAVSAQSDQIGKPATPGRYNFFWRRELVV